MVGYLDLDPDSRIIRSVNYVTLSPRPVRHAYASKGGLAQTAQYNFI
jgi:hypothetical protein